MPLPGNVGLYQKLTPSPMPKVAQPLPQPEILSATTNYERQIEVLKQSASSEEDSDDIKTEELAELLMDLPDASDILECKAQDCPQLVRKGITKKKKEPAKVLADQFV